MRQTIVTFGAIYALIIGTSSCGGGTSAVTPTNSVQTGYIQIERLARPAIKELFQTFAQHDTTNRVSPYQQPLSSQTLYTAIGNFGSNVAGRSPATVGAFQSILIPDETEADLSQTGTGSYLGVETGGATAADKDKFGGRTLADDVISISLGVVFGNTLSALGVVPDDGKETPCLTTDNVPQQNAADNVTPGTFPYVGAPH
jgi:hypothetical protein